MSGRMPEFGEALTSTQVAILRLVEDGASNAEAGARLGLAEESVRSALYRAFRKLGATDRAGAARVARASGQLDPPVEPSGAVAGVSAAAVELLVAVAEQLVAGRPLPELRRRAMEALTAVGRRPRPVVPSQDRRVAS